MKLCILGGGGFRTPFVYQALLRDHEPGRVDKVALYDIDGDRLRVMTAVLTELAQPFSDAPELYPTTNLATAIQGSDFVFAAVREAGLRGRQSDEHVALDLGVLGQETTGPGGLSFAMRTIPVMVDFARQVRALAPQAYFLNFTNPAGIITEALQQVLGDKAIGICDTPSGLGRRIAGILGLDAARVQMDYVGLNHLGWMRRVLYKGEDVLPNLLADDRLLGQLEEAQVFGPDWLRVMGAIPNEYLFYYYSNRDAVRTIIDSGETRAAVLARTQGQFYHDALTSSSPAKLWEAAVYRRRQSYMAEAKGGTKTDPPAGEVEMDQPGQQGYAGVALGVMSAIARGEQRTMILNVRNATTIPCLPPDAVVEVPTMVDANGVHPLETPAPSLDQAGLMCLVRAAERHALRAAMTGSRTEALKAFALHPLVGSLSVARQLLDGYLAAIPELARVLREP